MTLPSNVGLRADISFECLFVAGAPGTATSTEPSLADDSVLRLSGLADGCSVAATATTGSVAGTSSSADRSCSDGAQAAASMGASSTASAAGDVIFSGMSSHEVGRLVSSSPRTCARGTVVNVVSVVVAAQGS